MFDRKEILKQLESFHVAPGKPVIVHTSLRAIGEINGGAEALLSVLIECFTKNDGLLCIPAHTWESMVLDLNRFESCIGTFPIIAASNPQGVRSLHPTHSMVVFGNKSKVCDFIENEKYVETPTSPDGCYGKLYYEGGYVLLIGVNHTKNTFLHCVEEMLEVRGRLTADKVEATIIHKTGEKEKRYLYWFDESVIPDVSVNFGKFEPAFRFHGCIEDGYVGNAPAQLCSAVKMKEVLELIYRNSHGKELLADNYPLDENLYIRQEIVL